MVIKGLVLSVASIPASIEVLGGHVPRMRGDYSVVLGAERTLHEQRQGWENLCLAVDHPLQSTPSLPPSVRKQWRGQMEKGQDLGDVVDGRLTSLCQGCSRELCVTGIGWREYGEVWRVLQPGEAMTLSQKETSRVTQSCLLKKKKITRDGPSSSVSGSSPLNRKRIKLNYKT